MPQGKTSHISAAFGLNACSGKRDQLFVFAADVEQQAVEQSYLTASRFPYHGGETMISGSDCLNPGQASRHLNRGALNDFSDAAGDIFSLALLLERFVDGREERAGFWALLKS
jgi:hypothetical protein